MYEQFLSSTEFQTALQQAITMLDGPMQREYDKDADIHASTRMLGELCNAHFMSLDRQCSISRDIIEANALDFERVAIEILAFTQQRHIEKIDNIQRILQNIRTSSGIEPETGICVKDLLVSTWALIKHRLMRCSNAKDLVVDNLNHNVETGGGCLAGISARLTQPYCAFIKLILENAKNRQRTTFVRDGGAEDSGLELALRLSRESSVPERVQEEDPEFELALCLSRESNVPVRVQEEDSELELALRLSRESSVPVRVQEEDPELELALHLSRESSVPVRVQEEDPELELALHLSMQQTRVVSFSQNRHSIVEPCRFNATTTQQQSGLEVDPEVEAMLQAAYGNAWKNPRF